MIKSRNRTLDVLKGVAIILVIVGHSIQRGLIVNYDQVSIWKLIYTVHMPLFFAVSGYIASLSHKKINVLYLKNRFWRLIYPKIVWTLLLYIASPIKFTGLSDINFPPSFSEFLKDIIIHPDFIVWFLYVLFMIEIIIKIGQTLFEKNFLIFTIISMIFLFIAWRASVVVFGTVIFGLDKILLYFPLYLLGYYFQIYEKKLYRFRKLLCVLGAIVWMLLFSFYPFSNNLGKFGTILTFLLIWICSISGMIVIYYFFDSNIIKKTTVIVEIFSYIGKISLELYLVQSLVLNIGIGTGYIRVISIFISCVVISMFIILLTKKNPSLHRILFGN